MEKVRAADDSGVMCVTVVIIVSSADEMFDLYFCLTPLAFRDVKSPW